MNAYAIGNWGDAAIVEGMIGSLRQAGFAHVSIAPVDWRDRDAWIGIGADAVVPPLVSIHEAPRWMRRVKPALLLYAVAVILRARMSSGGAAARAYADADVVLSAGGGYLGGAKPGINLVKLGNIRAAAYAGTPAVMAPITLNPPSRIVRWLIRWGCQDVRLFVRDEPSRDAFEAIGLRSELVPDIALRSPSLVAGVRAAASDREPSGIIGWAPRGYRPDHSAWGDPAAAERRVLAAMDQLLSETSMRLRFIAHVRAASDDDDRAAVDRLASALAARFGDRVEIAGDASSIREAASRYADLDVLVTSRMHAAIFAMSAGTPAIAVAYEPKVRGVMTNLGLAERVLAASADGSTQELLDRLQQLRAPDERRRTLAAFDAAQARFAPFDASLAAAVAPG